MHQDVPNDELLSDSDFIRLDFDVTQRDQRTTDKEIIELVRQMFVELRQMRQDLHLHIQDEKAVITHAFPNADPVGHRAAHDAWIRKAEAQAKFWETLYTTLRIGGIVSLLGFLLVAGWEVFLRGPPK
jgi:hypothetical protein